MLDSIFAFVESILGGAGVEFDVMALVSNIFGFIRGLIGA